MGNWGNFEEGKTIGTAGTEGGTIDLDIEYSEGARISLEKNVHLGKLKDLYVVTFGVYGLLVHTHWERDLNTVNAYIDQLKKGIEDLCDFYAATPDDKRDHGWHENAYKMKADLCK